MSDIIRKSLLSFPLRWSSGPFFCFNLLADHPIDRRNCEGLMVKTLDGESSTYEPSNRSQNWLKVKKDYVDGMTDSFDLVPIGAFKGKGKRTGVYGGYLLATYDEDEEVYQTICKIGTGFKDEDLQQLTARCQKHVINEPKGYYQFADNCVPVRRLPLACLFATVPLICHFDTWRGM